MDVAVSGADRAGEGNHQGASWWVSTTGGTRMKKLPFLLNGENDEEMPNPIPNLGLPCINLVQAQNKCEMDQNAIIVDPKTLLEAQLDSTLCKQQLHLVFTNGLHFKKWDPSDVVTLATYMVLDELGEGAWVFTLH
ncbi:hypothetical protein PIB30_045602 [Stylosanthes scabra]|uniref:Uncharacterized protein n=1 Tax=Stylosanthes scabra TaxID=79078 RepID=A0ABU6RGY0_9FABA|nr:hypothetical protein [Stylosanthes scabra]